tara:strand:- start:824 stop:979 length:156 start_codon:yes stop_codon:yes gene_type:complete
MNRLPIGLKFKIKILNKKVRKYVFYYFKNNNNLLKEKFNMIKNKNNKGGDQ